jgi:hypothetical protein
LHGNQPKGRSTCSQGNITLWSEVTRFVDKHRSNWRRSDSPCLVEPGTVMIKTYVGIKRDTVDQQDGFRDNGYQIGTGGTSLLLGWTPVQWRTRRRSPFPTWWRLARDSPTSCSALEHCLAAWWRVLCTAW